MSKILLKDWVVVGNKYAVLQLNSSSADMQRSNFFFPYQLSPGIQLRQEPKKPEEIMIPSQLKDCTIFFCLS